MKMLGRTVAMTSLQKRRLFGLLLCASLSACEDSENEPFAMADAAESDASMLVLDASAALDAAVRDASGLDTSMPDATYLLVDKQIEAFPGAVNSSTLSLAVSDATPTCAAGELVCNGSCLPRVKGATANGCTVVNADFMWLDQLYAYENVGYGLASLDKPDNFYSFTFAVPLDGGEVTKGSVSMWRAEALGLHDGRLIVHGGGTIGCSLQSYNSRCLHAFSATGEHSVLPGSTDHNGRAKIGVRTVFSLLEESSGGTGVYQRSLFDGNAQLRFKSTDIGDFISNDAWALFSRRENAALPAFVLTKLGVPGMTFQLPEAGLDLYTGIFFHEEYVYLWRRRSAESVDYQRIKLGETRGETLGLLPVLAGGPVVSGDYVYFRGITGHYDWLYRMPVLGGPITVVATLSGHRIYHYFVTDQGLYVQLYSNDLLPEDRRPMLLRLPLPQ